MAETTYDERSAEVSPEREHSRFVKGIGMAPIQSPPYQRFVGIDVAATSVTAAWVCSTGAISRPLTIRQTPAGFAELEQQLCRIPFRQRRSWW